MKNKLLQFFATGAFISYLPTAILKNKKNTGAGLLGTFEGLLLYLFFMPAKTFLYLICLFLFLCFSVYVSQKVKFDSDIKDNPKIIIDEIVGFFVSMLFLPKDGFIILLAFILFRVFDTIKPAFIRKAESLGQNLPLALKEKYYIDGTAIVLDDVLAGICANLILQILFLLKVI
jgi:Phosphatidylglycerophosphatase A and related proteins